MKKLHLLRVVGARPQFMQVKTLRQELERRGHKEVLIHTGQHYDDAMSRQFFEDLDLPQADINLGVGSGTHGEQTAKMLQAIENQLLLNKFDAVVVDGDTNSTLAGALAAAKIHIPVVHVEAGMRSFDKKMPEEINRILTDHVSKLLFCPSEVSKQNLEKEGISNGVHVVGDLLAECFSEFKVKSKPLVNRILDSLGLSENKYTLLTLHRAENVDNKERLENFLRAMSESPWTIIWPIHPRTEKVISQFKLDSLIQNAPFKIISPVSYLEMLALESSCAKVLTDSGGVQREAYYWRKPGVILRDSTEWVEIVDSGWAKLFGPNDNAELLWEMPDTSSLIKDDLYQSTGVAKKIVDIMEEALS